MDRLAAVVSDVGEAGVVGAADAQRAGLKVKAGVVWCWRKGRELEMFEKILPEL